MEQAHTIRELFDQFSKHRLDNSASAPPLPAVGSYTAEGLTGPYPARGRPASPEVKSPALSATTEVREESGPKARASSEPPLGAPAPAQPPLPTPQTKPQAINPFAMPPIDTAGQAFETSIARLSMLEREVGKQH